MRIGDGGSGKRSPVTIGQAGAKPQANDTIQKNVS
jgi:hypothetical protein